MTAWMAMEDFEDGPLHGEPFGRVNLNLDECDQGFWYEEVEITIE